MTRVLDTHYDGLFSLCCLCKQSSQPPPPPPSLLLAHSIFFTLLLLHLHLQVTGDSQTTSRNHESHTLSLFFWLILFNPPPPLTAHTIAQADEDERFPPWYSIPARKREREKKRMEEQTKNVNLTIWPLFCSLTLHAAEKGSSNHHHHYHHHRGCSHLAVTGEMTNRCVHSPCTPANPSNNESDTSCRLFCASVVNVTKAVGDHTCVGEIEIFNTRSRLTKLSR